MAAAAVQMASPTVGGAASASLVGTTNSVRRKAAGHLQRPPRLSVLGRQESRRHQREGVTAFGGSWFRAVFGGQPGLPVELWRLIELRWEHWLLADQEERNEAPPTGRPRGLRHRLGCMGMSAYYGSTDDDEGVATIRRALELGIDFVDTAQSYGPLTNEELVDVRSTATATST